MNIFSSYFTRDAEWEKGKNLQHNLIINTYTVEKNLTDFHNIFSMSSFFPVKCVRV